MARRIKSCEFCEEDWTNDGEEHHYDGGHYHFLWYEVYPYNNIIAIGSQVQSPISNLDEIMIELPMRYCPNCGRKLFTD